MKILITSGGTKIQIDLVRSITNMSRGTFGSKICDSFWKNTPVQTQITFMYARDSRMPESLQYTASKFIKLIRMVEYTTFDDYREKIRSLLKDEKFDIICLAAEVSDYGVEKVFNGKYRSTGDEMVIRLIKLPKVITEVRELNPSAVLCGFKLLVNSTDEELRYAMWCQFVDNKVDICIGNDLRDIKADNHRLLVMTEFSSNCEYEVYTKATHDLARVVVDKCLEKLEKRQK